MRYHKPKPRYDPGRRARPPETPDDLDELKRLTGGYTPARPPAQRREEPWYDTRYQPSDEEPRARVGAAYRGEPDPNYVPDEYELTPAPDLPTPEQRFARPPRPPRERIPRYDDGRMTDELFQRLMRQIRESGQDLDDAPRDEPPGATGSPEDTESLDGLAGGPSDEPAPDDVTTAFGPPASAPADNPMPAWPAFQPREDPAARANQATDEQMRQVYSPNMPAADLEMRTEALFDEQMRSAFAAPNPDPFADPFADYAHHERQLFDSQMPINPFPDPGPFMGPPLM